MAGQLQELAVVGDALIVALAHHRRLHPVIEDLRRHPAQHLEGGNMAAQDGLQILVSNKAGPHHPAMAEHQREQPDDPLDTGLIDEHGAEVRKVDLSLLARWGLEAALEHLQRPRTDSLQKGLHGRIAACISELLDLAQQPATVQLGIGRNPLSQVGLVGRQNAGPRLAWPVAGRLKTAGNVLPDRFAVDFELPGDRCDRQPPSMQIKDHYKFPKLDHRHPPANREGIIAEHRATGPPRARPGRSGVTPGENSIGASGEFHSATDKPWRTA